jgi:cyclohexadieny/prephenate dehydrogenase / 3-phosphoshikimate 1-carboxyvinyltransferase
MTSPQTVAIVGLGMIGGSVARGLATRGMKVIGYDTNAAYLDAAVAEGVVSRRLSPDLSDIGSADIAMIAVYGDAAVQVLGQIEPHAHDLRLVTDVGSTKRPIVAAAEASSLGEKFVGSHPFAGDHRSGWSASRFDLFENEIVYLCPASGSMTAAFNLAHDLWLSLGAKMVRMDASEHDDLLAWTSHLPHAVSTALALALSEAGIVHRQLGRGGRDVTRLAASSPDVWTSIMLDNAPAVEAALTAVERQVEGFRSLLSARDREGIRERLSKARDWSGPGSGG